MKQKLVKLKVEIEKPTIIVRCFNCLPSTIDRTTRQKISKDIETLNNNNQLDLIKIYTMLHLTAAECTFFSCPQEYTPR